MDSLPAIVCSISLLLCLLRCCVTAPTPWRLEKSRAMTVFVIHVFSTILCVGNVYLIFSFALQVDDHKRQKYAAISSVSVSQLATLSLVGMLKVLFSSETWIQWKWRCMGIIFGGMLMLVYLPLLVFAALHTFESTEIYCSLFGTVAFNQGMICISSLVLIIRASKKLPGRSRLGLVVPVPFLLTIIGTVVAGIGIPLVKYRLLFSEIFRSVQISLDICLGFYLSRKRENSIRKTTSTRTLSPAGQNVISSSTPKASVSSSQDSTPIVRAKGID